jgi:hypothetical protein
LISIYNKAKIDFDFDTLRNLDQGKIKIKDLGVKNAD